MERDGKELEKLEFRYIILDESQRIKNKNSKTFKAINALKAEHRIALSGTPIENAHNLKRAVTQFKLHAALMQDESRLRTLAI